MAQFGGRPITATAAFVTQVIETAILLLCWLAWSFGFGRLPYSLLLSSAVFALPIIISMAAAKGLHLGREWGWWLSLAINAVAALCLLAEGSFDLQAVLTALLFLLVLTLLLLPNTRRYYFTFRP
jgi:hypothetical protein